MICKLCGAEYEGHANKKYCSKECGEIVVKEYRKEYYSKKGKAERPCSWCSKVFIPEPGKPQKYCSDTCRNEAIKEQNRIQGLKRKTMHKRVCVSCGVEFEAADPKKMYCTIKCRTAFHNRNKKIKPEPKASIVDLEKTARERGISYGKLQAEKLIDLYARVEVPEWARRTRNE